ncbi:MAG: 1-(5-phosphoribosyl)-5-[(5-phosphoribosylamino)methylideneamino]imidazole-4-carboxamide isomerase [Hydrotalea flava]|uniref:1-(5-phosphoribosyl)-5-[(5- phosphoribosylamino)methylideneamino]imidazole-4- carboxamide isomerase n=1 Tax=Hydrotalea TaxID=1004300 RepID=UPI0009458B12|nr:MULTISPECIES: 1-(5-phosphoribosyl)-5-[(5-phosphoribosylamino)methylideneamino]imidazole-4-carboxamide isomerase [Hydrotalea]MBY0347123.1 1-(5-phosphoribosyl)-5-[(5-phosphoribosylamino)methylideneamino]imidazole-4-carboxamide isomerase [Hydrotalea flava]RWZ89710.1 MAG: 1-(5-phosphoribosyl)-5-[(5-phosphoribosylamino)methylideneamino]imidazole-4-carboxamide isomerase [Hydrotalea sp. AMD]
MQIIPAIDIIDGKCVRLTEGDYDQKKIYNENPLEVAKMFEASGIQRLHLVDLDGAKMGKVSNWKVLETIATETGLIIDFGGGVKSTHDVQVVLESGAALVTVGSIAVKNKELFVEWLQQFGVTKFLLGADVKNGCIAIHGWMETTDLPVKDFMATYLALGVQQIFCTDVSKDGRMEGPSIELYTNLIESLPDLHLIASGGVSQLQDLVDLKAIGCSGAIVGKAIYENKISLNDLVHFNASL